jgi:hypothetical protein
MTWGGSEQRDVGRFRRTTTWGGSAFANNDLGRFRLLALPRALVETYGEIGARQMVARRVEELCEEARAEARERGWRLPAADEAELLDPMDAPRTPPKKGFTIPTWSAGSDIDAAKRARAARRAFIEAYRAAWLVWSTREDERTVVEFPHGTYLMRVVHACATAPPS